MAKFSYISVIVLILACWQGCQRQEKTGEKKVDKEKAVDSLTMQVTHTKRFAIDKSTSYQTMFLCVYHDKADGKRYLAYQNREKNCIQFYGFDSEALERKICFPRQGPNGVRKLGGFKVVNFDSVYVIDKSSRTLSVFDSQGVKKRSYRLFHGDETNKTSMALGITATAFFLIENDTIYLPAYPDRSPYYLGYPFVAVDLRSGNYEYVGRYTDYYDNDNFDWNLSLIGSNFSYCYNNSNTREAMIFSFGGDPYIYTGHPRNPLKNKYLARSKKFYGTIPPEGKEKLSSEEYYLSLSEYSYILCDPYRNLYYRIAMHRTELMKEDMTKNRIEDMPLSIIILDKNFKKVGEVFLPPNRYYFHTMFVEKEGLYISTAHYANADLQEDYLEFDVFEPVVTGQ